jgi:hypothetical protein
LLDYGDTINLQKRWRQIVHEYSGLKLTFGEDKLSALCGLAKQIQLYRPGDKYLAGLWSDPLLEDLIWTVGPNSKRTFERLRKKYTPGLSRDAREWRAATWSWASIDGVVEYYNQGESMRRLYATFVDTSCVPTSVGDDTGALLSARVVLEGRLIPVKVSKLSLLLSTSPPPLC